jgi:hypothetical protein
MSDKTLKVEPWGDDQGDFVLIDADNFDENLHTLIDDGSRGAPKEGTAAFIKAKLDELGISYKAGAAKAELQALLDQAASDAAAANAAAALVSLKAELTAKGIAFDEAETQEALQAKLDAAQ